MKKLLMYLLLLLPLAIASCGGDDKDEPQPNQNQQNSNVLAYTISPSTLGGGFKYWIAFYAPSTLSFRANYRSSDGCESCKVSRIGVVTSLSAISSIPTTNWQTIPSGYNYGSGNLDFNDVKEGEGFVVEITNAGAISYEKIWVKGYNKSADGSVVSINIEQHQSWK